MDVTPFELPWPSWAGFARFRRPSVPDIAGCLSDVAISGGHEDTAN